MWRLTDVLAEVAPPVVGLTPERWDVVFWFMGIAAFALGLLIAREL